MKYSQISFSKNLPSLFAWTDSFRNLQSNPLFSFQSYSVTFFSAHQILETLALGQALPHGFYSIGKDYSTKATMSRPN